MSSCLISDLQSPASDYPSENSTNDLWYSSTGAAINCLFRIVILEIPFDSGACGCYSSILRTPSPKILIAFLTLVVTILISFVCSPEIRASSFLVGLEYGCSLCYHLRSTVGHGRRRRRFAGPSASNVMICEFTFQRNVLTQNV